MCSFNQTQYKSFLEQVFRFVIKSYSILLFIFVFPLICAMIATLPQLFILNTFDITISINTIAGILFGLFIFPLFSMCTLEFKNDYILKYKFSLFKLFLGFFLFFFIGSIIDYFIPEITIYQLLSQLFENTDILTNFIQRYINLNSYWYLNTIIQIFFVATLTIIGLKYLFYYFTILFFKFIFSYFKLLMIINSLSDTFY